MNSEPWDPRYAVHTFWDIGYSDQTSIWFAQRAGPRIALVEYFEQRGEDVNFYIKQLRERPYRYGEHWGPHDMKQAHFTNRKSALEAFRDAGFNFQVVPSLPLQDGIKAVRAVLPRCYFDTFKCDAGLKALKNYRSKYNEKLEDFSPQPIHDKWSHGADAFRMLAIVIDTVQDAAQQQTPNQAVTDFDPYEA